MKIIKDGEPEDILEDLFKILRVEENENITARAKEVMKFVDRETQAVGETGTLK